MHNYKLIILILIVSLYSCNSNTPASAPKVNIVQGPIQSKMDDKCNTSLSRMLKDYFELKEAFVATNAQRVDSAIRNFIISTDSFKTAFSNLKFKDDTVNYIAKWSIYIDSISFYSNQLLTIKDTTCELKRVPFSNISDQFFTFLKLAQIKNAGIYQQHCPMAFDNKGANWLSNESEIKNPYFGKKMLECGDLTDSLK